MKEAQSPKEAQRPVGSFLALSMILTGFAEVDLLGTGMVAPYCEEVVKVVGQDVSEDLWNRTAEITMRCGNDEKELEAAVRRDILSNAMFGPLARNIIQLWYTGIWNELPRSWRARYGTNPNDTTRMVSSAAYQQGLIWKVIDAHPPAAQQPGFASWASAPSHHED